MKDRNIVQEGKRGFLGPICQLGTSSVIGPLIGKIRLVFSPTTFTLELSLLQNTRGQVKILLMKGPTTEKASGNILAQMIFRFSLGLVLVVLFSSGKFP